MSREIRRVPKEWEHPTDDRGHHIPMYDHDVETKSKEWFEGWEQWRQGIHKYQIKYPENNPPDYSAYIDYAGRSPNPETCRPAFTSEPTCYQIYETVSEGTPVSPVFESEDEMESWLIGQGTSFKAAKVFIKSGWVPSGMYSPGTGFVTGYEIAAID